MELKKGDVIIFKAEEHWLSKVICWLTDSDVCHAAMVYSDQSIVECIAPGVCINPVTFKNGDEFHLLRMEPEVDPAPLLAAADYYRNTKICYDFSGLILFGGLLLIKKLSPVPQLFPIVNRILMAGCKKLNSYIHHALLHTEPGMVCSQFVYQVYHDCGKEYRIQLQNAGMQNSNRPLCLMDHPDLSFPASFDLDSLALDSLGLDSLELGALELGDLDLNSLDLDSFDLSPLNPDLPQTDTLHTNSGNFSLKELDSELKTAGKELSNHYVEVLCKLFLSSMNAYTADAAPGCGSAPDSVSDSDSLSDSVSDSDSGCAAKRLPAISPNTLKLADAFLLRIRKLLALTGQNIPIDAMFVTPADLAYHAVNLNTIGDGALERK